MTKRDIPLRLRPFLLNEARKATDAEGVALDRHINVTVTEKLTSLRKESFFAACRARADVSAARAILRRAGVDKPPVKEDRLPRARAT